MKSLTKNLFRVAVLLIPAVFLCSCYEIIHIQQDSDASPLSLISPTISIQVYGADQQASTPYVGFLVPSDWKVKYNFPCSKTYNGLAIKIGVITYSSKLSEHMEKIEPSPPGYKWWVGIGNFIINANGTYVAHPTFWTGNETGGYFIDYMFGDSYNGLNYIRSDKKPLSVVNAQTPHALKLKNTKNTIELEWEEPDNLNALLGYDIYRNGEKINDALIVENNYVDDQISYGSYEYEVKPIYIKPYGVKSVPAKVCHSPCGPSIKLNGFDNKLMVLDAPSLEINSRMTLEAWINKDFKDTQEPRIISKGGNGSGFELFLSNLNGFKTLEFKLPNGNLKSKTAIKSGTWYHVAASYDGEVMKLYINGKPDCEKITGGNFVASKSPLLIGRSSSSNSNYFKGNIDEVRIWNIVRTEEEIWNNFSCDLKGTEKGLIGSWSMNEGCNNQSCDLSPSGNDAFISGNSCWCPIPFPFVEDVNNISNPQLLVPVMNYEKETNAPNKIELEFKINPKVLQFKGIDISATQLAQFSKMLTFYNPNGTIKVVAINNSNALMHGNVLLKIKVKALQPNVNTMLKFNAFLVDGQPMRTLSGKVVATALPKIVKTTGTASNTTSLIRNVYPNPATNYLNLELGELTANADLKIFNIAGQEIQSIQVGPGNANSLFKIDLFGISEGIYFVKLVQNRDVAVKKFAVQ